MFRKSYLPFDNHFRVHPFRNLHKRTRFFTLQLIPIEFVHCHHQQAILAQGSPQKLHKWCLGNVPRSNRSVIHRSNCKIPKVWSFLQVITLSPTGRRRLARELLDAAFPLANVNVQDLLRQTSTAHKRTPGESLPLFQSQYASRRL